MEDHPVENGPEEWEVPLLEIVSEDAAPSPRFQDMEIFTTEHTERTEKINEDGKKGGIFGL